MTFRRTVSLAAAAAALAALLAADARAAEPAPPRVAARGAPIVLEAPKDLAAAVKAVAGATGAEIEKLEGVPTDEGRSFAVAAGVAERLLEGSHAAFRKAGFYLFRYERGFGVGEDMDHVGLLATADRGAVIRRMRTGGGKQAVKPEQVVAFLDALEREAPFELWEVGTDYVAGRFLDVPKDPMAVAQRCAALAPDLVAGRASTLQLLANEIRTNRTLYLIW